jgi:type IV secretion system protein VirB9
MNKKRVAAALGLLLAVGGACAADVPRKSPADVRIRYATYNAEDVVIVHVRPGVVTRIVLSEDEKITVAGTGLSARCDDEGARWCIKAEKDSNQIWVKPYPGATTNNLEVSTDKRDYSFKFDVAPGAFFRVVMQYPIPERPLPMHLRAKSAVGAETTLTAEASAAVQDKVVQRMRNTNFALQFANGGEAIAPALVFDDGRYTYFRYPKGREIPAVFAVGSDGQEIRVNYHVEDQDVVVAHRTSAVFRLRLGDSVVQVLNQGFDPSGIATETGVTDDSGVREIRK